MVTHRLLYKPINVAAHSTLSALALTLELKPLRLTIKLNDATKKALTLEKALLFFVKAKQVNYIYVI